MQDDRIPIRPFNLIGILSRPFNLIGILSRPFVDCFIQYEVYHVRRLGLQ